MPSPASKPPRAPRDAYRSILLWAWAIAIFGFAVLALTLYLRPEWRQSELAMVVEEVDEEGQVKRQVKVERKEPNKEQVREIARNQERKKRRELKREVKKIVEVVRETERIKRQRKKELESRTVDDEAFRLALEIEVAATQLRRSVANDPIIGQYPTPQRGSTRALEIATELADAARSDTDGTLSAEEAGMQLEITEELVRTSGLLAEAFHRGRSELEEAASDQKERNRIRSELNDEIRQSRELLEKSESYLTFIRDLLDARRDEAEPMTDAELAELDQPTLDDQAETMTDAELAELSESALDEAEEADIEAMLADYRDEALEAMTAHELYEASRELGEQVNENFTEARAAELAAAQSQSFEEALEDLYRPEMPEAPDLSDQLGSNAPLPTDSESFETYNAALDTAARTAQDLAQTAESRASQIAGPNGREGNEMSGRELSQMLRAQTSVQTAMSSMASTEGQPSGTLADMTGLMAQAYALSAGGASGNDLGPEGATDPLLNRGAYKGSMGLTTAQPDRVLKGINTREIIAQSLPGRKFTDESARKGWLFIDTWYIIGPWERPRNAATSFDAHKFPPETLVDFDAKYPGKPHPKTDEPMRLEWRFVQTDRIRINPPDEITDAVYYAYTEVHSDRSREVLLAVGSDDYAKIWINDLVVWEEQGLSSWSLDQGFRKVLLKKGYNTILLRLESGPGVAFFSLMLMPEQTDAVR